MAFLAAPLFGAAAAGTVLGTITVGGALGAVATVAGLSQANRAVRYQQAAAQTQVKMQQAQARRERRQGIRTAMIRRSQARAGAEAMGTAQTSAFAGGMTSLSSQLGSNLGFGSMMSGLGEQYTSLTGQAAAAQSRSQLFGTVGNMFGGFQPLFNAAQTGFTAMSINQRNNAAFASLQ